MRAALFPTPHAVEVTTLPDPTPAADEVVIQVAACGICGTDLHIFDGEFAPAFPITPGHEFAGTVVALGREARHLRVGDRVAVDPNIACGTCEFCRRRQFNHCLRWQGVGITRAGAFAELVAAPERVCYRVPEELTDLQAAFIEPLSCVVHALNRVRVLPGDDVLVIGAGPIGLLLAQGLARSGAGRVYVTERQPARLALAERLGFATVPADAGQAEQLRAIAPHGFPLVADATGSPAAIAAAAGFLRCGGTFLQFGVAPMQAEVPWKPYDIFRNEWTIIGTFALCYTFDQAIALLRSGAVIVEPLVSHTLPLAAFPEALGSFARSETLKVQIRP